MEDRRNKKNTTMNTTMNTTARQRQAYADSLKVLEKYPRFEDFIDMDVLKHYKDFLTAEGLDALYFHYYSIYWGLTNFHTIDIIRYIDLYRVFRMVDIARARF